MYSKEVPRCQLRWNLAARYFYFPMHCGYTSKFKHTVFRYDARLGKCEKLVSEKFDFQLCHSVQIGRAIFTVHEMLLAVTKYFNLMKDPEAVKYQTLCQKDIQRWGCSVCAYADNYLYITGGATRFPQLVQHDTVFRYDIDYNAWATESLLQQARSSHSSCVQQSKVYVFGGWLGDNRLDSIEFRDLTTEDPWKLFQQQAAFTARDRPVVCPLSDQLILIMGGLGPRFHYLSDAIFMDTERQVAATVIQPE